MKITTIKYHMVFILAIATGMALQAQALPNDAWLQAREEAPETLTDFYTDDAVRVFISGKVAEGPEAVAGWWTDQRFSIDSLEVIRTLEPHVADYRYEISALRTTDGRQMKQLVIWNLRGETPKRELEFVATVWPLQQYREQLDARRAQWMTRCNAHQAGKLVEELYAANALYYNHRPIIQGREAIINTYQYMNRPGYYLELEPIIVEPVSEHIAFEIGQCKGSYPGKYVLVWQKDETGQWYILLDSNI